MTIFLNHVFLKAFSEPRGRGLDALIKQSILENKGKFSDFVGGGRYDWFHHVVDVKALMLALDQLQDYYSGGDIKDEQWMLAAYYAYSHLKILDEELTKIEVVGN